MTRTSWWSAAFTLAVLCASGDLAGSPGPLVTIRSGLPGDFRVTAPAATLESVRDLAYDADGQRFYLLRLSEAGQEVESRGRAADKRIVWKVDRDLILASILYIRKGVARCVAREKTADRMVELTFDSATAPEVRREVLPTSASEFDRLLNPARFESVRALMTKLSVLPTLRSSVTRSGNSVAFGHVAMSHLVDSFFVNARDLYGDSLSATPGLEVFVLAHASGRVDVVTRVDDEYHQRDIGELVRSAVLRTYHSPNPIEAPSIQLLSAQVMPKGVMLEAESETSAGKRYHTVHVDLSGRTPKAGTAEEGRLARTLERF